MRISNINQYQGGANDVVAREYVNGTKTRQQVTIQTGDPLTPLDLTGFSTQLDVTYGTSSITPSTGRTAGLTINSLSLVTDDSTFRSADSNTDPNVSLTASDMSSIVTITNATQGQLHIQWPNNLFPGYVPFNTNTVSPVVIANLRVSDAATETAATNIYSIRFLLFVRYGVIV